MKKALLKNSFKEIKTSYKRFISILLIALLGVGFFAGLRATSPDMVDTIDKYYKEWYRRYKKYRECRKCLWHIFGRYFSKSK